MVILILPSLNRTGHFPMNRNEPAFSPFLAVIPFYILNVAFLIPYYLKKGKYLPYILFIGLSYGAYSLIDMKLHDVYGMPQIFGRPDVYMYPAPLRTIPDPFPSRIPKGFHFFISFPFLMVIVVGICFEMIIEWEKQKRKYEETQKEKVSTELSFLKSQINPHFLFNTLNNIYSLATAKSDDTERAILLLSQMMRYVLYEAGTEKIMLVKEIEFIENYIALQRIRLSCKREIAISFERSGDMGLYDIEPMLLLPLVENAFKHGISYREKSYVKIRLEAVSHEVRLVVENTIPDKKSAAVGEEEKNAGIGLENIKKRLRLLYPDQHAFTSEAFEKKYCVRLTINM